MTSAKGPFFYKNVPKSQENCQAHSYAKNAIICQKESVPKTKSLWYTVQHFEPKKCALLSLIKGVGAK